jgi:hypothetical protein
MFWEREPFTWERAEGGGTCRALCLGAMGGKERVSPIVLVENVADDSCSGSTHFPSLPTPHPCLHPPTRRHHPSRSCRRRMGLGGRSGRCRRRTSTSTASPTTSLEVEITVESEAELQEVQEVHRECHFAIPST